MSLLSRTGENLDISVEVAPKTRRNNMIIMRFWSTFGPILSTFGPILSTFGPILSAFGPISSTFGPILSTLGPICPFLDLDWQRYVLDYGRKIL